MSNNQNLFVQKATLEARITALRTEQAEITQLKLAGSINNEKAIKAFNEIEREMAATENELGAIVTEINKASTAVVAVKSARDEKFNQMAMNLAHTSEVIDYSKSARNPAYRAIQTAMIDRKSDGSGLIWNILANEPTFDVVVHTIAPFVRPRGKLIGYVVIQVPKEAVQVKVRYNNEWVWDDMSKYNFDAFKPSWNNGRLEDGSGFMILMVVRGSNGKPFVIWPKDEDKKETDPKKKYKYDVFRSANPKFKRLALYWDAETATEWTREEYVYMADNNDNFAAGINAYVSTFWGTQTMVNPTNRLGYNEHCGNCRHMVYMRIDEKDGVNYENTANQPDVETLSQYGSRIPQWICSIREEFVDQEIIEEINEAGSFEVNSYHDKETGQLRFLRKEEVLIKGQPVNVRTAREEATKEKCAECPFYCKNEKKPEAKYIAEVEAAIQDHVDRAGKRPERKPDGTYKGIYVNKYWTERAQSNRMAIFTKHNDNGASRWDLGYPGEFNTPSEFVVHSTGGVRVKGTPAVRDAMRKDFVAPVEAVNVVEAEANKLTSYIYTTAFRFAETSEEQLAQIISLIQEMNDKELSVPSRRRLTRAIAYLQETITAYQNQQG